MKRHTVSVEREELYLALKAAAVKQGRSVKDLVEEAIEDWLEALGEAEDIADSEAALAEWREQGGIDAFAYFREREAVGDLQD